MIQFAARTHPGRRPGDNEDSIGWDTERQLFFVADGMGGHAAGGVASNIVKKTLLEPDAPEALSELALAAHAAVAREAEANPEYHGMGSTLVCAHVSGDECSLVWVGDSRAYLWREGTLRRLTKDHSFAEILRSEQGMSDTEVRVHPARHVVTQTLGLGTPEPSVVETRLHKGDWIVLCSDGLTDELTDPAIIDVLAASETVEQAADALVDGALNHGGRDNTSVVVLGYEEPRGQGRAAVRKSSGILLSIMSGVGVAVIAALCWYLFGDQ